MMLMMEAGQTDLAESSTVRVCLKDPGDNSVKRRRQEAQDRRLHQKSRLMKSPMQTMYQEAQEAQEEQDLEATAHQVDRDRDLAHPVDRVVAIS